VPGNDADNQLADDSLNGFSDMWLRLSRILRRNPPSFAMR
jgi:hypothetical protein